jgi:hypothetical protein
MRGPIFSIRSLLGLALVVLLSLPGLAAAQDGGDEPAEERPSAELTEEQLVLNDEGVRSLIEGDYAGAVAMLTRSIKLGPSNVAYLNLGRAYQKLDNCEDARDALQKVRTAPVVDNPPPGEVNTRAEEFMTELEKACEFDEQPDAEGDADGAEDVDSTEKTSGEPPESEELPNPRLRPEPQPEPESGSSKTAGIILMASGVTIAGGGVGMHLWARDIRRPVLDTGEDETVTEVTQARAAELESDANLRDTIGLGMVIGGGIATGIGTFLLIRGGGTERSSSVVVQPTQRGFALGWRTEF